MKTVKNKTHDRMFWGLLVGIGLVGSAVGYVLYHHLRPPTQETAPIVIDVATVQAQTVSVAQGYIGRVEAINDVKVLPYISGYVADIEVVGGQQVQKGKRLLTLRQEEYMAAKAVAEANLFAAKADFLNVKMKYERMQKAGIKAVSRQNIDDAEAAYEVAESNLQKAEADCLIAQTNFDYTILTAPFAGTIGNIAVSVGDFVSPQGQPLLQIVQYSPIRVVFSVSDKEYLKLAPTLFDEKKITVKLQLADGQIFPRTGEIKYTDNEINKTTNSIAVYAEFINENNLLLPNAYVKVLLENKYENVVLLPKDEVLMENNGFYINIVRGNIVSRHSLTVLAEKDGFYVVANDFIADERLPLTVLPDTMVGERVEVRQVTKEK